MKGDVVPASNSSVELDLLAPAYYTTTSVPGGGYTDFFAGTSAATPHVAGAMAVLKARFPDRSHTYLLDILKRPSGKTNAGNRITDPANSVTTPAISLGASLYNLCPQPNNTQSSGPGRIEICSSPVFSGPVY